MEKKHIVLIEDNVDDIELTLRSLRTHNIGNEVVVIRDGAEAIDYFFGNGSKKSLDLAVVFLDLKLPKVSGLEVLKRLREDERTKCIPVVILTSSKEESDVIDGYKFGANSYIRKPVNFDEFTEVISKLGLYWLILNEPIP